MQVVIPDDVVQETGVTEAELRIEIACRLFDAGRLHLWPAARMAGLSRPEFEAECRTRQIPVYRPTVEDVVKDLENLRRMGV